MMIQHMLERIKEAARKTYALIAPDLFRASETNTLTQSEVLKYIAVYLDYGNDAEAVAAFNTMSEEEKTNLLKEVFPANEYRWEHKP